MFAADTHFKVRAGGATFVDRHLHELAHAIAVNRLEGIGSEDALFLISDKEVAFGVITGIAVGHLGQVIGAEGEELSLRGNFASGDSGAWNFDHRAKFVFELDVLFAHHCGGNTFEARLNPLEFLDCACQRNHHFGLDHDSTQSAIGSGFHNRADLHFHDFGHDNAQADAAQTHHRVGFVHALDGFEQAFLFSQTFGLTLDLHFDNFAQEFFFVGHELVKRRINQADDNGVTVHGFKETVKVLALGGQKFVEGGGATFAGFGEDHILNDGQALWFKEHVLGAAQTDTHGAIGAGALGILRVIGVRPNLQTTHRLAICIHANILARRNFISPFEQGHQFGLFFECRHRHRDLTNEDLARCAVH